jgi:hypothetical protein
LDYESELISKTACPVALAICSNSKCSQVVVG